MYSIVFYVINIFVIASINIYLYHLFNSLRIFDAYTHSLYIHAQVMKHQIECVLTGHRNMYEITFIGYRCKVHGP